MIFHEDEKEQFIRLYRYHKAHTDAHFLLEFGDGETYVASWETAYETDNATELLIDVEDARYDEFHQIAFRIITAPQCATREYNGYITIDYRDFPSRVINVDMGEVVYPGTDEVHPRKPL